MKKIAIYGSTGSIGTQALDVIRSMHYKVNALVAYSNIELLAKQAKEFKPSVIGILDESAYQKDMFYNIDAKIVVGKEAEFLVADSDADLVLISAVGFSTLTSLMSCIKKGKRIALSNKECIVSAGHIIMSEAQKYGAEIIPVDSEHSAVWQCLRGEKKDNVKEIILTASGGRYYNSDKKFLSTIKPEDAVIHPNWKMGKKISVDSATMMNKALEIIEARWLFGTKNIGYIIHPESIIHSMVAFNDGAIIAQMAVPDMRLPISVALSYPERQNNAVSDFDFKKSLTFLPKREDVFFAPQLAYYCIETGGTAGAILDGANESAVKLYMDKKIRFDQIAELVRDVLYESKIQSDESIEQIKDVHDYAKRLVIEKVK